MPFIVGWVLNAVYCLVLLAVAPVLIYRRVKLGKYKGGWSEKLTGGLRRRNPDSPCIWIHAVSVGEVLQLQNVLNELAARFPQSELLITTTTDTGYQVARDKYPSQTVCYFPLDFTWAVSRALKQIRPALVVLVELELWPNFIAECRRRQVPLALINGRVSEKSNRGYRRIKPLIRRVLSCVDVMAVQNEEYRGRLLGLGANPERVFVTGNIKFDRVQADRSQPKTQELRQAFGIEADETVLIAGSTQAPEEMYALDAWRMLRQDFPRLRLILVPRHKERFDDVAELVHQRGLPLQRRSQASATGHHVPPWGGSRLNDKNPGSAPPVLLLDTLGELAACWGLADIAFVGGSLTNRGGQNMLEPAGYGAAVLFGPNTWNFKDITLSLLARKAARVVTGPDDLVQAIRQLLEHPEQAAEMGQNARSFVLQQQGATARTVDVICQLLTPARISRAA